MKMTDYNSSFVKKKNKKKHRHKKQYKTEKICATRLERVINEPIKHIPHTVEEEHAIQTHFFAYTRFHSRNIFQVISKNDVSIHTNMFLI